MDSKILFTIVMVTISYRKNSAEECCLPLSDIMMFTSKSTLSRNIPACARKIVEEAMKDNPNLGNKGVLQLLGHGVYDDNGNVAEYRGDQSNETHKRNSINIHGLSSKHGNKLSISHGVDESNVKHFNISHGEGENGTSSIMPTENGYVEDLTIYGHNTSGILHDSEKLIKAMNNLIDSVIEIDKIDKNSSENTDDDSGLGFSGAGNETSLLKEDEPVYFNITEYSYVTNNTNDSTSNNRSNNSLNTTNMPVEKNYTKYPKNDNTSIENIDSKNITRNVSDNQTNFTGHNITSNSTDIDKKAGSGQNGTINVSGNRTQTPRFYNATHEKYNSSTPSNIEHTANAIYSAGNLTPGIVKATNHSVSDKQGMINITQKASESNDSIYNEITSSSDTNKQATEGTNPNGIKDIAINASNIKHNKSNNSNNLTFCLFRKKNSNSSNVTDFYFVGANSQCQKRCARGVCDIIPPPDIIRLWTGQKHPADKEMVSICVTKRIFFIGKKCSKIGAHDMLRKMLSINHFLNQPGNAYLIEIISMYGGFFPDNTKLYKGTYLTRHLESFLEVISQANHILTSHNIVRCRQLLKLFSGAIEKQIAFLKGSHRKYVYKEIYGVVRKTLIKLGLGKDAPSQNWLDNLQCQILNQDQN